MTGRQTLHGPTFAARSMRGVKSLEEAEAVPGELMALYNQG
jgi:hypothetical protein